MVLAGCSGAATGPSPAEPSDPLDEANATFRALYAENRLERLGYSGSAIVVQFDVLILFEDGVEVRRETFTPALYHDLKAIAHIPLAIVVVCSNALETPTDDGTWRAELARLRDVWAPLDDAFLSERFPSDVVDEQRELLRLSRDLIATLIERPQPDDALLRSFALAARPLLLRSAERAAQAQLDGLHRVVEAWRGEMGPGAWDDLHVMVLGPKTPRAGNLQFEYFARVMGRDAAGERLVYAEGIFAPEPAMNLLGTLLQDRAAADIVFDDPTRLDRDLLADAAAAYLDRLFGEAP
jgi:hypothetical protein